MKKRLFGMFFLMAMLLPLTGCMLLRGSQPVRHTFSQSRECVVRVEICSCTSDQHPARTIVPIMSLTEQEVDSFWTEMQGLSANTVLPGETDRLGDLLFRICYLDGTQELLGYNEQCVLNTDGSLRGYKGYVFQDAWELTQLFAKYADPEVLTEKSEYFRHFWNSRTEE